jgi:hypothetical protein
MINNTDIIDFIESINLKENECFKPSETVSRKFTETLNIEDFQVLSDNGFIDIKKIGKTIPYLKYKIKTNNHTLECADTHIVIDSEYDEIFVKDLNRDTRPDKIITESGVEVVREVINTGEYEEMYDLQLDENSNHLFFTNGVLSHNSIWLANDAANFTRMGYNTAFITAEMAGHKVIKRIGSNLLNITMSDYDAKAKDAVFLKRRLETVGDGLMPPGKLFVKKFPTSQANVLDIENYLLDVEETAGIKLKAVIIDYINILSNHRNPNSENTYLKIKQIAEDLRAMADRNKWLIITATQIKRGAYNSTDIGMEDISESAGLAHTADMIYAIIQDELMHAEHEYWLKVLKIRDGEGKNLKCKFSINYDYMRLTETSDTSSSGL